ncbi:hypothetical protein ERO13_A08G066000v2 [Gossypium hirsutum]|uniref:PHD-type domain-containing protein n=1 Tax=Gossypium hirsutum TaxID=3635 RepID=A0A1U8NTT6_GOSHI|nr:uncharacterized protein LOC107951769 [Gossypium hirsutum]KAG4186807.1 hypothetical protein ERO13_A08G066000v2 [Gossypium hirsutum]KAG4186808.1 hypothetical protein ERO13_A08G066000v2 [Gossypium hirsutum]
MGGGFESSCLQFKPDKSEVLPRQDIVENKGDDLKLMVLDLNEEPLVCSLKEVEFEKKEGLVEDNDDDKEDSVKKNSKEEGLKGEVQFSGRVLRSRSAVKNQRVIEGDKVDKTEDDSSSAMKTTEVVKEGNDQSHTEVNDVQRKVGKMGKRKRGRPPKLVDKGNDQSHSEVKDVQSKVGKMGKRKRGRPPKLLDKGNDQSHSEVKDVQSKVGKIGKRKRGRPPKLLDKGNDQSHGKVKDVQSKVGKMGKRKRGRPPKLLDMGNDQSHSEVKDVQSKVGKMGKCKRGRPPKFLVKNGSEKKTPELQVQENDYPDGKVRKELKCKRGRPPKVLGNGGSVKKGFTIKAVESDHVDGDVSRQAKRKCGRPRKVPENSGFEKKGINVKAGESNQLDGGRVKKPNHKRRRGRPMKGQKNEGVNREADEIKARESYSVETRKETNHKHDVPPRMNVNDGFEMKPVDVEMGEGNHFDCELRKEVNRKRGRPPKMKGSDRSDQCSSKVKEGMICKRGRPPKLQAGGKGLKSRLIDGRKKLGGLRRCRKKLRGRLKFNISASTSLSEKKLIAKDSNLKRFLSANRDIFDDMEKNEGKASLMVRPKVVKKARAEGVWRRSEAKQALRDRIVNLLKAAGWKIDYRPRIKKEYNDAVYVNPEGKTHWSVTLAYRVLKSYYENGGCDSKVGPNDFIFTPIPEEELSILKRVVLKRRVRKKMPKGEDDDKVDDGQVQNKMNNQKRKWKDIEKKKKKKQKVLKEKLPLHEEENSDGTLQRGTQVSSRKRKLQQTQKRKRYALLVRNSMDGAESDNNGYVLYDGKRTLLSWMIDLGTVPQNGKVEYLVQRRTRTRESKAGRITRDGIQCNCCSDVFTIADFETHAGGKIHQPFLNICLETGVPLLQCLLDAWNKQQQSECRGFHFVDFGGEDPNDDTCGICGDGGDLICCDGCPSTFHQSCLDIEAFPSGNWNCVYCTCKYCGMVGNTYLRGKTEDTSSTILTCHSCEEKYHEPCIQPMNAFDDDSSSAFFCGKRCKELFERLQMLVGVKHELQEGFSWALVQRFDITSDVCLNEAYQKVESNSKLAVALSVMDECFLPLVDHRSGINLIHNIVYNFWSNFTRLNYSGFYTAILERGDEVISAASIRIHGNLLAEMPFIGTRYAYRRQGMCCRLLCAIESALRSLNVQKLVIPAVPELRETWTSVFGFQPLETASKPKMRNMNILVFPGVDMLEKPLLTHVMEEQIMGKASDKSVERCPVVFDLNVSAEDPEPEIDDRTDEPAAIESTTPLSDGTLKYTFDIMAETVNLPESAAVSSSCIPAPEESNLEFDSQNIYSEEKADDSIVKQNLDSEHAASVKHSDNIGHAENEVAVPVQASKDAGKDVLTNGFDGTVQMSEDVNDIKHHGNSKLEMVECVSDFVKTVVQSEEAKIFYFVKSIFQSEEAKICHAIGKDATNQTSPSTSQGAQHAANGHYDVASNDSKSGPSRQGVKMEASGEVSSTIDVNFITYEVCNDTSKRENVQQRMCKPAEVVSAGSEVCHD